MTDATAPTTPSSADPAVPPPSPPVAAPAAVSPPTPTSPDTTTPTPPASPVAAAPPADRPAWLPESFKAPEELVEKFNEYATRVAAEDSRKASLPQTPEAYEIKLPETFTAPEGIKVDLNPNDPLYKMAREMAHAKGWSQSDFSEALGVVATMRAGETAAYEAAKTANLAALGAKGPERIDAVTRWLIANGSPEEVKPIIATLATSNHVTFFEKMIAKLSSQGAANFRRGGEDVDTGKVTPEVYEKMSYGEKKAYAERMSGKAA